MFNSEIVRQLIAFGVDPNNIAILKIVMRLAVIAIRAAHLHATGHLFEDGSYVVTIVESHWHIISGCLPTAPCQD